MKDPYIGAMLEPLYEAKRKGKKKFKVETDLLIALVERLGELEEQLKEDGEL